VAFPNLSSLVVIVEDVVLIRTLAGQKHGGVAGTVAKVRRRQLHDRVMTARSAALLCTRMLNADNVLRHFAECVRERASLCPTNQLQKCGSHFAEQIMSKFHAGPALNLTSSFPS
jgi:hypothetical protein